MTAPIKHFTIEQGSGFERTLRWTDARKRPVNLAGWVAELIAVDENTGQQVLNLSSATGGIVIDALAGKIKIEISDAQTAALSFESAGYILKVQPPVGFSRRLLQGRLTLSRSF